MLSAPTENSTVYVVDDDEDFRESVAMLLSAWGWQTRVFVSALDFAENWHSLEPGPVLLDLRMPSVSGLELLEAKAFDFSRFPTIVVTGHGDVGTAVRSLKAGAVDFLEKPFTPEDLTRALEETSNPAAETSGSKQTFQALKLTSKLTEREVGVLRGLLAGQAYKVIAYGMDISPRTVEMHRDKVLKKLGVRTNGEAVRIAVMAGIDPVF